MPHRPRFRLSHLLPLLLIFPAVTRATVIWNESVNGSLSSNQATPTAFTLSPGISSILGSVGTGATQDWVAVTIPAGQSLSSLKLFSYTSTDAQGFMGIQAGSSFVGSTNTASNYLGYSHFGTGAANGALPVANLVGTDLLPLMGDKINVSLGSQGFTPPLAAGTYTLLFQQLGASTSYQFDFGVTPIPEPASLTLLAAGGALLVLRQPRRIATCRAATREQLS